MIYITYGVVMFGTNFAVVFACSPKLEVSCPPYFKTNTKTRIKTTRIIIAITTVSSDKVIPFLDILAGNIYTINA